MRAAFRVLGLAALGLIVGPAEAQTIPAQPGPLPTPIPYFGTKTLGNKPAVYPDPNAPKGDPVEYWKRRIVSTGGTGCGATVIIVNSAPCYVPTYYAPYAFDYRYNQSSFGLGGSLGNLQFGYRGASGYQSSNFGGYGQPILGGLNRDSIQNPGYVPERRINTSYSGPAHEPQRERLAPAENNYYLHAKPSPAKTDAALAEAIADIRGAFLTGDVALLERHVDPKATLVLQSKGATRTPISGAAYLQMTREAVATMKTSAYSLDKVEPASRGAVMVHGRHTLRSEGGGESAFLVGFILKKQDKVYLIAEVSAEPAR